MIEYLTANLWLLWTLVAMICLILELSSGDFFVTCFAIGAICAILAAVLGLPLWLQVLIFAIGSVLSILFVRPSLLKHLHGRNRERVSNADALIGRVGTVTDAIEENGFGYVAIDGDSWRSHTASGAAVEAGTKVKVVARDSIVLTVEVIGVG